MKSKLKKIDLIMIAPTFIIYTIFMVIPICICFFYSFTNWNGIKKSFNFIGLNNYFNLLGDSSFIQSVRVTLIMTIGTTVCYLIFGLILAVILDRKGRAYTFSKTAFFIPTILSTVVVSAIWSYMTQFNGGIINTILNRIGLNSIDFYSSKSMTLFTVCFVIFWAWLGFFTTIFLTTLQTIPQELYEAAAVDGVNWWNKFKHITLPLMAPGITINSILCIAGGLKQYDYFKIMISGTQQTITVNAVARATEYNMFAYSCAIIVVLFLGIAALSLAQIKFMKKFEVDY